MERTTKLNIINKSGERKKISLKMMFYLRITIPGKKWMNTGGERTALNVPIDDHHMIIMNYYIKNMKYDKSNITGFDLVFCCLD